VRPSQCHTFWLCLYVQDDFPPHGHGGHGVHCGLGRHCGLGVHDGYGGHGGHGRLSFFLTEKATGYLCVCHNVTLSLCHVCLSPYSHDISSPHHHVGHGGHQGLGGHGELGDCKSISLLKDF
jgi:hypothetical protein